MTGRMLMSSSGISRAIAWRSFAPHLGALGILGVFGALGGALGGAWIASGWLVNPPPILALQAPPPILALQAAPPILALQAAPPILALQATAAPPILALQATGALYQLVRYGDPSTVRVGVVTPHALVMPPADGNVD